MPRLEVLQQYLGKGTDVERTRLTALLVEVDRGNRAMVKDIRKHSQSQSGCDSWEAVCAQWLVDHNGQLANNLRGADSIMLRMMQEINNPFVAEVRGQAEEEIDWNSPEFRAPAPNEAAPPSVPTLASSPLRGEKLSMAFVSVVTDALAELGVPVGEDGTMTPAIFQHRGLVLDAAAQVLLNQPQDDAFRNLQQLVGAAFRGSGPALMVARVWAAPGEPESSHYLAFVGEARYFQAMGFDLTHVTEQLAETKSVLDDWSDDELKAVLKTREAARRTARKPPATTDPAVAPKEGDKGAETKADGSAGGGA